MRHGVLVGSKKIKREMSTVATNPRQLQQYSGQWNVEVVRNKVTTRCFWTACKAFTVGLLLLIIGTSMAVVGYYADQLSIQSELKGNSTVRVKNESRGYHLNNLSYAGPIIMGIGGFIVVAACVMTFEARDSAAKVVPAKFKPGAESSIKVTSKKSTSHSVKTSQGGESKRNTGSQTPGSKLSGSFKMSSASGFSPINDPGGRRALTAAFFQFSQALMEHSSFENDRRSGRKSSDVGLNKSPSAPNLGVDPRTVPTLNQDMKTEGRRKSSRASPRPATRSHRGSARPLHGGQTLLNPHLLQRQALSMDSPFYDGYGCPSPRLSRQPSGRSGGSKESLDKRLSGGGSGSQASMALDLHDCQVTLTVKDETQSKRSDTARRHQLLRQKPVEDEKEDKANRCSCIPKMCTHTVDDSAIRTYSRSMIRGPRHQSLKINQRNFKDNSKNLSSFRQRSFSHSRSYTEDRKLPNFRDFEGRIYCIEDQNRYPSCERIKRIGDDRRFSMQNRWSPDRSPQPQCRVHRQNGSSECIVHGNRDPAVVNHALVRKNAKRRKSTQKMESSLSIEENQRSRSFSRSPTDRGRISRSPSQRSPSVSPTRKGTCRIHPDSRKGSPVRFAEEIQNQNSTILPLEEKTDEIEVLSTEPSEEPS